MEVFEWAAGQAIAVCGVGENRSFGHTFGLHAFANIKLIRFGLGGILNVGPEL